MIDKNLYKKIEEKYGSVSSWALWEKADDKPKSNMSKLSVFDFHKNPSLYDTLKTNIVMVGLNFSREVLDRNPFSNFHSPSPYANDFKIRFAFEGTSFYGAYMTDLIKNFPMLDSKDVIAYLKKNPSVISENIKEFKNELNFIGSKNAIILAFGSDTYKYLKQSLSTSYYQYLVKLTHYSHQISKEKYRKEVHHQIYVTTDIILLENEPSNYS